MSSSTQNIPVPIADPIIEREDRITKGSLEPSVEATYAVGQSQSRGSVMIQAEPVMVQQPQAMMQPQQQPVYMQPQPIMVQQPQQPQVVTLPVGWKPVQVP